jgi:integrase
MRLKRIRKGSNGKAEKPYPEFPLFAHQSGRWCKKIRGQHVYFGPLDDPNAALQKWLDEKDYLLAGKTPPADREGLTVRDLVNGFLTSKQRLVESGERRRCTYEDYHRTSARIIEAFGRRRLVEDLQPSDFGGFRASLASGLGPVALANQIARARAIFNWGVKNLLVERVRFGDSFNRPSRHVLENARQAKGPRMFEAAEIRILLDKAPAPLRAMILLGINAGLGNADCGRLETRHLDLAGGWLTFPRGKTGAPRRARLWPESLATVRKAIAERPEPKDPAHANLVFVTRLGASWHKDKGNADPIAQEFAKLLSKAGIDGAGKSFYALRHTLQTIGDEVLDSPALDYIMGHRPPLRDMAARYRERISDERLARIADHVRAWLFPPKKREAKKRVKVTAQ